MLVEVLTNPYKWRLVSYMIGLLLYWTGVPSGDIGIHSGWWGTEDKYMHKSNTAKWYIHISQESRAVPYTHMV